LNRRTRRSRRVLGDLRDLLFPILICAGLAACASTHDPSDDLRVARTAATVFSGGSDFQERKSALLIDLQNGQQYRVEQGETLDLGKDTYDVAEVSATGVVLKSDKGRAYRIPPLADGTGRD
jgi:hypothetical protein